MNVFLTPELRTALFTTESDITFFISFAGKVATLYSNKTKKK